MPSLTIKMVQTQETDSGTEIYVAEIPAVATQGVALAPPNTSVSKRHTIGVFSEAKAETIADEITAKYPADRPSEALTENDIEDLVTMAKSSTR